MICMLLDNKDYFIVIVIVIVIVTGEFPAQRPVTRSFNFLWSAPEKTVE